MYSESEGLIFQSLSEAFRIPFSGFHADDNFADQPLLRPIYHLVLAQEETQDISRIVVVQEAFVKFPNG